MVCFEQLQNDSLILMYQGRLNFKMARNFFESINKARLHHACQVILNFEEVSYVDAPILGLIEHSAEFLRQHRIELKIVSPEGSTVRDCIEARGMNEMVPIFGSTKLACA